MADLKDPKAQAKGEPQVEIQDDPPAVDETVTVDITPKLDIDSRQSKIDEELQKMQRRMEFQARQFEKKSRQLDDAINRLSSLGSVQPQNYPAPQPTVASTPSDPNDVDQVVQVDWKKAVNMLAEKKAREILEQEERRRKEELDKQNVQEIYNRSRNKVVERYPGFAQEEDSPEARTYSQMYEEDPTLWHNPQGPEIAMYRMEERLRANPPKRTPTDIDLEVQRRTRIASAYVPSGTVPTSNKIVMTKAEQQYCDANNIPYDQYAKIKSYDPARLKEGVEVE